MVLPNRLERAPRSAELPSSTLSSPISEPNAALRCSPEPPTTAGADAGVVIQLSVDSEVIVELYWGRKFPETFRSSGGRVGPMGCGERGASSLSRDREAC